MFLTPNVFVRSLAICSTIFFSCIFCYTSYSQNVVFDNLSPSGELRLRSSSGLFDDVLIPVNRFSAQITEIPITQLTFAMNLFNENSIGTPGSYEVFWGAMADGVVGETAQPIPVGDRFFLGSFPDEAVGAPLDQPVDVTLGDGVTPLFTLDSSNIVTFRGVDYYAFVIGMRHVNARSGTGWLPAIANEFNLNFIDEDVAQGIFGWSNSNATWTFSSTSSRQTFSVAIQSSVAPRTEAEIVGAFVYYAGSAFDNSDINQALDQGKTPIKETATTQTLGFDQLINSNRGLNGLVFDIQNLASNSLSSEDFVFQISPTGPFDQLAFPPAEWATLGAVASISVVAGSPDRVVIQWPDNSIANQWLRVTILANANTGLAESEVYYVGHLLGESNGLINDGIFTVSFADITPIRSAVGSTVDASSTVDIDKNGTVAFADISAMRANVGSQLPVVSVPTR